MIYLTLNTNSRQWSGLFRCITPAIYMPNLLGPFIIAGCDGLTQLMGLETIPVYKNWIIQRTFCWVCLIMFYWVKNKQLFIYPSMPSYKRDFWDILNLLNIESTITRCYILHWNE